MWEVYLLFGPEILTSALLTVPFFQFHQMLSGVRHAVAEKHFLFLLILIFTFFLMLPPDTPEKLL